MIFALSNATGVPEPALRFLVCTLLTYPISTLYRWLFLVGKKPVKDGLYAVRSLYNVCMSMILAGLFVRYDAQELLHPIMSTGLTWLWCKVAGDVVQVSRTVVGIVGALGNFFYMLVCYYYYASDDYDMNWLIPMSVLCLRLMGFCMDYMDGLKPVITQTRTQEWQPIVSESERGLSTCPSIVDTFGFAFYYGGFLAGPQFPFKLYEKYLTLELFQIESSDQFKPIQLHGMTPYALKCFFIGLCYVASSQLATIFLPTEYLLSQEFQTASWVYKLVYLTIWGKFSLHKYIGTWQLVEGGFSLSGISYNGFNGKTVRWDGLSNCKPYLLETVTTLNDVISGFNINTNLWSKTYVFKRLRFLGNKNLSLFGTLFFLAIWHGLHAGYFLCFALEFLDMEAERKFQSLIQPLTLYLFPQKQEKHITTERFVLQNLYKAMAYVWSHFALSYALVSFHLLHYGPTMSVWSSVGYVGHVLVLLIYILDTLIPASWRVHDRGERVKTLTKKAAVTSKED